MINASEVKDAEMPDPKSAESGPDTNWVCITDKDGCVFCFRCATDEGAEAAAAAINAAIGAAA